MLEVFFTDNPIVLIGSATLAIISLVLFIRNIMLLTLSMNNYKIHKKRLKQLEKQKMKSEADLSGIVDLVTKPFLSTFLSELKPKTTERLDHMIKIAKWEHIFTPVKFRILDVLLKGLGLLIGYFMWDINKPIAAIWGGILFFGLNYFLKNTYNNRKDGLMRDFPDFIRIMEGYLTANMSFSKAVVESIKYVGEEWKPVLQKFAIDVEIRGIDEALDNLKKEVDIFEVREFVSIVRLTLEQGGDAKDSFKSQAEKIREMQLNIIAIKIGKRQTMSIALQGPLLLSSIVMFALPTVGMIKDVGIL